MQTSLGWNDYSFLCVWSGWGTQDSYSIWWICWKQNPVPECNLLRVEDGVVDFKADHSSKAENTWLGSWAKETTNTLLLLGVRETTLEAGWILYPWTISMSNCRNISTLHPLYKFLPLQRSSHCLLLSGPTPLAPKTLLLLYRPTVETSWMMQNSACRIAWVLPATKEIWATLENKQIRR